MVIAMLALMHLCVKIEREVSPGVARRISGKPREWHGEYLVSPYRSVIEEGRGTMPLLAAQTVWSVCVFFLNFYFYPGKQTKYVPLFCLDVCAWMHFFGLCGSG